MTIDYNLVTLPKHKDHRGSLVEFLKRAELESKNKKFGQIYFVTFDSINTTRGNHYHKKTVEWFGVAHGSVHVVLENINTKERKSFELHASANEFIRLRVGTQVAHAFKSITHTAVLLDYANKEYDPQNTDRYSYVLLEK